MVQLTSWIKCEVMHPGIHVSTLRKTLQLTWQPEPGGSAHYVVLHWTQVTLGIDLKVHTKHLTLWAPVILLTLLSTICLEVCLPYWKFPAKAVRKLGMQLNYAPSLYIWETSAHKIKRNEKGSLKLSSPLWHSTGHSWYRLLLLLLLLGPLNYVYVLFFLDYFFIYYLCHSDPVYTHVSPIFYYFWYQWCFHVVHDLHRHYYYYYYYYYKVQECAVVLKYSSNSSSFVLEYIFVMD